MTLAIEVDATLTLDVQHAGDLAVCLAATSPGTTESLTARVEHAATATAAAAETADSMVTDAADRVATAAVETTTADPDPTH